MRKAIEVRVSPSLSSPDFPRVVELVYERVIAEMLDEAIHVADIREVIRRAHKLLTEQTKGGSSRMTASAVFPPIEGYYELSISVEKAELRF